MVRIVPSRSKVHDVQAAGIATLDAGGGRLAGVAIGETGCRSLSGGEVFEECPGSLGGLVVGKVVAFVVKLFEVFRFDFT